MSKRMLVSVVLLALTLGGILPAAAQQIPEGFVPPPLHPDGATLHPRELAPGVYALVSDKVPVDNSGFVIGDKGVLVIDSHISKEMADQILAAVRAVTHKPILYLVNTNYHGDHTFGNYAFPSETLIIAHRETAEQMKSFEYEKSFLLQTVQGDTDVFGKARLRLPDVVFDDYLRLDLGGKTVELRHFGRGNTRGDTVVYVPDSRTAWTGNLVLGFVVPPVFEGGADEYQRTLSRFAGELDVATLVPGHGGLTDGAQIGRTIAYLNELLQTARTAVAEGLSLEETLDWAPVPERYLPPTGSPQAAFRPVIDGFHRLGLQLTYQELSAR
jgi:cyclase